MLGGFFDKLAAAQQQNPQAWNNLAAGLMAGGSNAERFSRGMQGYSQGLLADQKYNAFQQQQADAAARREALQGFAQANPGGIIPEGTEDLFATGVLDPELLYEKQFGQSNVRYGQPQLVLDAQGNEQLVQFGSDGSARPVQGYSSGDAYKYGTREEAQQRAEFKVNLPANKSAADSIYSFTESVINDPALSNVNPITTRFNEVFGDAATSKVQQIKNQAFMIAREALKGGGQITDFEGNKAEAAVNRLTPGMTVAEMQEALREFQWWINEGVKQIHLKAYGDDSGLEDRYKQPPPWEQQSQGAPPASTGSAPAPSGGKAQPPQGFKRM